MDDYDRCRSLVGRFSIYLLAYTCNKRKYLCIQILKPKDVLDESIISTYIQYYSIIPSKFASAISNHSIICFMCLYRSWSHGERSISSMLSGLFSLWVFIHLSLHERLVIGMSSLVIKIKKNIINKLPRKVNCLEATRGFG